MSEGHDISITVIPGGFLPAVVRTQTAATHQKLAGRVQVHGTMAHTSPRPGALDHLIYLILDANWICSTLSPCANSTATFFSRRGPVPRAHGVGRAAVCAARGAEGADTADVAHGHREQQAYRKVDIITRMFRARKHFSARHGRAMTPLTS